MTRAFRLGSLDAEEELATPASWHFELLADGSKVGTVDVHFPCSGDFDFHATVCLATKTLAEMGEPVPSEEQVIQTILHEFKVRPDQLWSVLYIPYENGRHLTDERGQYD